jgi:hypothetical protein
MWLPFVLIAMAGLVILGLFREVVPQLVWIVYAGAVLAVGLYILFTRDSSKDPY